MQKLRAGTWIALIALSLVLVACGGGGGGSSESGGGGASETAKTPIKIGISLPLTGPFTDPGVAAKRGYETWRDIINQKGGLLGRPVELVILDDASNENTVVADYNRLISQEKVDLVLGTFSSKLNYPASAVAEKNGYLYIEPAGGAPEIFQRGFKRIFFAQQATAPHQADLFAKWIASLPEDQRPKTAAYVTQDDPFTKPVIEGVKEQLEALGIKTVYGLEVYPPETTNFTTIANALKAANADVLVHGAVFEDGVGLVRALQQVGYNPKAMFQSSAPSHPEQYPQGIGKEATEGIFFAMSYSPAARYPGNEEFLQVFRSKFGQDPAEDAADAFAAAQVLQAAAEAVGSLDQDKMAEWLHKNTVQTILGPLSWDEAGRPQQAFLLAQWQGGAIQIVLPEDVATSDHIVYPKPAWPK